MKGHNREGCPAAMKPTVTRKTLFHSDKSEVRWLDITLLFITFILDKLTELDTA